MALEIKGLQRVFKFKKDSVGSCWMIRTANCP